MKTYACKKAIKISRFVTKITTIKGITAKAFTTYTGLIILTYEKLAKIFKSAWPEVMLANRRTAKLIILDKWDTISIKIINGMIKNGVPAGIKWFKKCTLNFINADNHKKLIVINEIDSVTATWLVKVKTYGNKPKTLLVSIVMKINK